nr:hypothetical protein SYMBAF_100159 [Serratia symbiotica]
MTYRLLIFWLLCYAAIWTLLTVQLDPTLPYDAVEAYNWGAMPNGDHRKIRGWWGRRCARQSGYPNCR